MEEKAKHRDEKWKSSFVFYILLQRSSSDPLFVRFNMLFSQKFLARPVPTEEVEICRRCIAQAVHVFVNSQLS
ncbi:unnamed protein product [Victoria cruziana]